MNDNSVAILLKPESENDTDGSKRGVLRIKKTVKGSLACLSAVGLNVGKNVAVYLFIEGTTDEFFPLESCDGAEIFIGTYDIPASAAVVIVKENNVIIDLYGRFIGKGMSKTEVEKYAKKRLLVKEGDLSEKGEGLRSETENQEQRQRNVYDDEMIASENYFEFEKNKGEEDDKKENENVRTFGEEEPRKEKESDRFETFENETGTGGFYYEKIRSRIEGLFRDFPEEKSLCEMVAESRWVRVSYDGEKHYVVGIIYDGKIPEYICYGAPGRYGEKPREFKGYCSFIPSSPFALKRDGYWVTYQSAASGKRI